MFKKSGIIFLLLLYVATSTGFALNLHFCGENIASVKINTAVKDCGMSSKCCKETHLEVKVKDAHQAAYTPFNIQLIALPAVTAKFFFDPESSGTNIVPSLLAERTPPPDTVSRSIKNSVFRI